MTESCPDCKGTRQSCGCSDCEFIGACIVCCSTEDFRNWVQNGNLTDEEAH